MLTGILDDEIGIFSIVCLKYGIIQIDTFSIYIVR
jgi:hypothetical protein